MNYYPFHPGDYLRDTAHLEPMEDLTYRRLLDMYYLSERPIPLETDLVSRRLRLGSEWVIKVLSEFFQETEEGWIHGRCDREITVYKARSDRARVNGKAGGRPKKTQQVISGLAKQTQTKANQNQNQNQNQNKEEKKLKLSEIPDEQWMASIKADPDYNGINIENEFKRAHNWCLKNGRQNTRRFFANWLGKCEKPIVIKPKSAIPDYSKLPSAL